MMNVLIAGGTGFIGKHLINSLLQQGYHVYILTRSPNAYEDKQITYVGYDDHLNKLPHFSIVINLAGDTLFGLWTKRKKERIYKSRIKTTQFLIDFMKKYKNIPEVFINGSAIGFYGTSEEEIFTEKMTKPGSDFLAQVVHAWEETAKQAKALNTRTIFARFGLILHEKSGAFPLMTLPVKLFFGGRVGKGEQWISWIHIEDVVRIIDFCIRNDQIHGPINFTSPQPTRNKTFMRMTAKMLKRPYWFPTPEIFLKLSIGEMSMLITHGQYVKPRKLELLDFKFQYPTLKEALKTLSPHNR